MRRRQSAITGRVPRLSRGAFVAGARLVVAAAAGIALVYGVGAAEDGAREIERRTPTRLEWVTLPNWLLDPMQRDILLDISAQADVAQSDDVFEAGLAERVAYNLNNCSWIESVRRVSVRNSAVRVDAVFRTPLTLVAFGDTAYLVDDKGVRLPRQVLAANVDPREWIVLAGVRGPVPPVGESWNGKEVADGLALVRALLQRAASGQLACRGELKAVDVSNYDGRVNALHGRLRIVTTAPDLIVHWGLPVGEEYGVECGARHKLERLDYLARTNEGRLPRLGNIDLRPLHKVHFDVR